MNQEFWNLFSSLIAFFFVVFLGIIGWFIRSSWSDLKQSISEIKAQLIMLTDQQDFDKLKSKVDDQHDRIILIESKIKACKSCNG